MADLLTRLKKIDIMSSSNVKVRREETELLEELSKEALIGRVEQLEAHITQLKNIMAKQLSGEGHNCHQPLNKRQKIARAFDFKKYCKRHVLLKVCYLGWDYQGLAVQEETLKTIEHELFRALLTAKFIESRETSNYHRCGRTDKGVSAFGQVISIDLRTNLEEGRGIVNPSEVTHVASESCDFDEIRYAHILNKLLPAEIRILAWAPVDEGFSARFNCRRRTYKYYFPEGDLDIALMREAGQQFIGHHDFRNFCKMDVGNGVVNYVRVIDSLDIRPVGDLSITDEQGYRMMELTIGSTAFLWHQIRCMVSVLFLVGRGQESPNIVEKLLDVNSNPCKPQYCMAAELPLVLFDCEYNDVSWQYDAEVHVAVLKTLQDAWTKHAIRAEMVRQMLSKLEQQDIFHEAEMFPVKYQSQCLTPGNKSKVYKPLLTRPVCESLENRLLHHKKKRLKTVEQDN